MATTFVPRTAFPALSLPRSYFLGHHKAGLERMKSILSSIDLVVECRDYRIPLTSRNPLLEHALAGRDRLIVYTHRDLGAPPATDPHATETTITAWHAPTPVCFFSAPKANSARAILETIKERTQARYSLTGHRVLVAGMPNVGKSTLLNALRRTGVNKGKAARTGAQPGVTRKIATSVKIVDGSTPTDHESSIYILDTPGVFMPYVPSAESMLKLALCGAVKDSLIPPIALADYLLYHMNLAVRAGGSTLYAQYAAPTNDISELLDRVARKTGRLKPAGVPDHDAAAVWLVQRWRGGHLGRFGLDDVSPGALEARVLEEQTMTPSMNQARKMDRERRRQARVVKYAENTSAPATVS